jgi:hypothetical protein
MSNSNRNGGSRLDQELAPIKVTPYSKDNLDLNPTSRLAKTRGIENPNVNVEQNSNLLTTNVNEYQPFSAGAHKQ